MKILCTFPGRYGDLLWALPAIRALFEATGAGIDLAIAGKYASLCPLIEQQPYVSRAYPLEEWVIEESAPITPRIPPTLSTVAHAYDQIIHLGYTGWPLRPLPYEAFGLLREQTPHLQGLTLDLDRPWISVPRQQGGWVAIGFTDEHFELKYGLCQLLSPAFHVWNSSGAPGSRWATEAGKSSESWLTVAGRIVGSTVFFGCCSALHVLACALGVPVVMMEPNPHRHHPIFYPYGQDGPQVTLIKGNDGQPTWDSRHCRAAIEQVLHAP